MSRNIQFIGSAIGSCGRIAGCEIAPYTLINQLALAGELTNSYNYAYQGDPYDENALYSYFSKVAEHVRYILKENHSFPLLLGGDHSCAIGTWSGVSTYLSKQEQDLGLIWVDAHLDAHRPDTSPSGNLHGMPVAHLLGYGYPKLGALLNAKPKLKPENLVYFGIRSYESAELELLDQLGVKIYYQDQLTNSNFPELFEHEFARLGATTKVGISLDLDGLSASEFKAVGTPEDGGVSGKAFLAALDRVDFNQLVAFEIAEYNPKLDADNVSGKYLLQLIKYLENKVRNDNQGANKNS